MLLCGALIIGASVLSLFVKPAAASSEIGGRGELVANVEAKNEKLAP